RSQPLARLSRAHSGAILSMMSTAATLLASAQATLRERLLLGEGNRYSASMREAPQFSALGDAVDALTALGLPHALIGGLAVGVVPDVPRATLAVDLAIASTADRTAVIAGMVRAGFRLSGEFPHSLNFRHSSGDPV